MNTYGKIFNFFTKLRKYQTKIMKIISSHKM